MIPGAAELAMEAVLPVVDRGFKMGMIQATQVFGTLVVVEPDDFVAILDMQENPLVVRAITGKWRKRFIYLTSYQGLSFCARSARDLDLPEDVLLIAATKVFLPV
jgi:hypothetical protein